jgi:hypothetical protein
MFFRRCARLRSKARSTEPRVWAVRSTWRESVKLADFSIKFSVNKDLKSGIDRIRRITLDRRRGSSNSGLNICLRHVYSCAERHRGDGANVMEFDFVFGSAVLVGYFSYLVFALIRALLRHDLTFRRIHRL